MLRELCKKEKRIGMSRVQLLKALQEERRIDIICADGKRCDELIYSLRKDTDCEWLFIARGKAIDKDKYMWIFCGGSGDIWRGRINRLGFKNNQTSFTQ